jgi:hypothetical protein
MSLPEYFQFEITSAAETDLVLVSITDNRTGFVVRTALPNSGKQVASIMAFAGARYSRSDLGAIKLFQEIKDAKKDANSKLATIFRQYGHASVADMANLFAYIENVPQYVGWKFFYSTSLGGGQERSTRYQDFGNLTLQELGSLDESKNQLYLKAQETALSNYQKWKDRLTKDYIEFYKIDQNDKSQIGALTARVFDSCRYFLPTGACNLTSLAYITSAREWARLISMFKSEQNIKFHYLAEQLEFLFAPDPETADANNYVPEAADLIRYTGVDETWNKTFDTLHKYLESIGISSLLNQSTKTDREDLIEYVTGGFEMMSGETTAVEKTIYQVLLISRPNLTLNQCQNFIKELTPEQIKQISNIIFQSFTQHKQMPQVFQTNSYSFVINQSISEARDINRHRSFGRFTPFLETKFGYSDFYNSGYQLPLYLTANPEFLQQKNEFEADLKAYYELIKPFKNDPELLELLPFGHNVKCIIHGSIKEFNYLFKIRTTPGVHINTREIVYKMSHAISQTDLFLQSMAIEAGPDPLSQSEFIDRS